MTKKTILKVSGLKVYFPIVSGIFRTKVDEVKAVDGVDFTLFEKEVLGLVGESGSGKSTTAKASLSLIEPTEGNIEFEGEKIFSLSKEKMEQFRLKTQIIFQDPYASLNPRKTLEESVGEGLKYYGLVKEADFEEVMRKAFTDAGLSYALKDRYPHEISGGQQQRVCIARAIAMNPKLLICDEAVSALDVSVQSQILNLLMDLKEERHLSLLFITHDLSVVRHIADRIAVMKEGRIIEIGPTEEIFENPQNDYTKKLLKAIPMLSLSKT